MCDLISKNDDSGQDVYAGDDCGSYHENEGTNEAGDHAWGEFESPNISVPVPGNHEWENNADTNNYHNLDGYYEYFGEGSVTNASGDPWYKKTMGDWTFYMLDSTTCVETAECQNNAGTVNDGEQFVWLQDQLDGDETDCTAAVWHHPLFSSSSPNDGVSSVVDLYKEFDLNGGGDLVLNGHRHNYERFDEQNWSGSSANPAPMEFVVGTGGAGLNPTTVTDSSLLPKASNSALESHTHGILKLTLNAGSFTYQYDNQETGGTNEIGDGPATVQCDNED